MALVEIQQEVSPEFSYHLLRNALNDFDKNLSQLEPEEYEQVYRKASQSYELESLVLASPEAVGLVIPDKMLDQSMASIAGRYAGQDEFIQDLQSNGLNEEGLRHALFRELMFDAVMRRVVDTKDGVSEVDARLFYELHHEQFAQPELRITSHILITVNPDYPENTRDAAWARMEQVVAKLAGRSNRFSQLAKQYSECPTAVDGGALGEVKQGQLYPELDSALFSMEEGEISSIIESEMGFHVLLCEKIKPGKRVPFTKAEPKIREILQERQRRSCQKAWLAALKK